MDEKRVVIFPSIINFIFDDCYTNAIYSFHYNNYLFGYNNYICLTNFNIKSCNARAFN